MQTALPQTVVSLIENATTQFPADPLTPASLPQPTRPRRRWLRRLVPWIAPAAVMAVYLVFVLRELPDHRHQVNPDGVSYLSIARQVAAGHFADSVSAYWSPLYSWLMAPLFWLRIDPVLISKIAGIGIGAAAVIGLMHLMRTARVRADIRLLLALASLPFIVDAIYVVTTPDLLVGAVLLFYLAASCRRGAVDGSAPWWTPVWIGLLGGLAYLAKAYALPFVLAHLLLVRALAMLRRRTRRGRLLLGTALTLLVMALIVGAWSAALTAKVGFFTTGTTGSYNLRIDARNSPGQVMHFAGFLPPPNPTAWSAWDDITPHMDRLPRWDRMGTPEDRAFFKQKLTGNYERLVKLLDGFSPLMGWLAVGLLLVAGSRADARAACAGLVLASAALIYPCGYLVLHMEERFLVPLVLMLIAGAGYLIGQATRRGMLSGPIRPGLAALVVGATFLSAPMQSLDRSRHWGRSDLRTAEALRGVMPAGASIASDSRWGQTLYLSMYLDLRYYGEPAPRTTMKQMLEQLDALDVEYLALWRRGARVPAGSGWVQVAEGAGLPFKLYRRVSAEPPG